ncbi:MAG TPA: bifunctional aspartate kinase/homoserine dehydrogenase I [Flavobacteriales bacterium]|nr:bifunctional aspartate kinase/homoserine dehydrogenase I [Flavobacteriales bacterium]
MEVIKFGGSSLASASTIRRVGEVLVSRRDKQKILVLSAMGGMTNKLISIGELACSGDSDYKSVYQELRDFHLKALIELVPSGKVKEVEGEMKSLLDDLDELCYGIYLLRELSDRSKDELVAFGERLSIPIVVAHLNGCGLIVRRVDARDWIKTDANHGAAHVLPETTKKAILKGVGEAFVSDDGNVCDWEILAMEGFIGQSPDGATTTLGRGGSDYTAALMTIAVKADHLEKSTDVIGMLTADPRKVPTARIIEEMSYAEAMELCHFGAKIIYPPTIAPLMEAGIPLIVRSTFEADGAGTRICADPKEDGPVRGLSSIGGMSLLTLVGGGMVGVPGFSRRLFIALSFSGVNVVLITQGSSEHSITVAIEENELEVALEALQEEFGSDLQLGRLEPFRTEKGLSILALVGDGMDGFTGICGKAFHALGRNGINIYAIAQGSTERNISIVVADGDVPKALRALHGTFFESDVRRVHLFCMGVGNVGGTLVDFVRDQHDQLLKDRNIDLQIAGLANSKKMLFNADGIDLSDWRNNLASSETKSTLDGFIDGIKTLNLENSAFVDNTASSDVAALYESVLSASIGVVASNKIAAADAYKRYKGLLDLASKHSTEYRFETNVGAGLPVIDTIQHLVLSGDKVHKIEAVLSGTLNFLFSAFSPEMTFEDSVKGAMDAGFTEPDPRIDLSGVDVQRKILILAREAGYKLEMSDVENVPFLPQELMEGSVEDFLKALPSIEQSMQDKLAAATKEGKKLRYFATFENGKAKVALEPLDASHAFCSLEGSDNVVMLTTDRYSQRPLVVQGAGAGADVTAMGVFADIMRFAESR